MLSKEEYVDWKHSKGTEALYAAIVFKIQETANYMTSSVLEPAEYARCVGRIQAFQDILNTEYEGEEDADSTVGTPSFSSTRHH